LIFVAMGRVTFWLAGRRIHPLLTMVLIGSLAPVLPGVLDKEGTLSTSTGIFPDPGLLLWYFVIFLSGAVAYHQREFWLQYLRRSAIWFTVLFLILFTAFFFVQDWGLAVTGWIYGAAVVLGSYAVIGLFLRFGDKPSRAMTFVADASYWLYLVHLPLVFLFLVVFSVSGFGAFATIALSSTLTLFLGLLSYKVLVRHTVISNLLNGKRHPFGAKKQSDL
jgi:glucan biosynthesis protein C